MWQSVLMHPLSKNVHRYCQELVEQRKKLINLESQHPLSIRPLDLPMGPKTDPLHLVGDEQANAISFVRARIDYLSQNLVLPIRIIGQVASQAQHHHNL